MFGFFLGTACLLGLIATVKRRRFARWGRAYGGFGGCGPAAYGPSWGAERGPWGARGYGERGGRGGFAGRVAEHLGLREDQMTTVEEALRGLEDAGRELRNAGRKGREQLAAAFRGESLDENALGEAQASFEEMTEKARKAFVDALAKVHGVLDADQRRAFARFLEEGFGGGRPFGGRPFGGRPFEGGPYRSPWF